MIQTKTASPKTLAAESEQAIHFLAMISDQLKQQRRHFDDAVVTHCIRLINDYVEEQDKEPSAKDNSDAAAGSNGNGKRL
jgi:hypothetical protein